MQRRSQTPSPLALPPDGPSWMWTLLAGVVLALAAWAAYANTFHVPFYFDDRQAITDNDTIEDLSWGALNPPSEHCAGVIGRPLVNFSLAINYYISERREWSYHEFNLIFHVLAACLLMAVLRRTFQQPPLAGRFGVAAFPLAFCIALVWTLHPLVTETVTNAIQRDESLVAIFYLLTFYLFLRSLNSPKAIGWQAGTVAACFIGVTAKEVMVTAPLLVLLYDRTFVAGSFRAAWEKRRYFYAAMISSWVALAALLIMDGQNGGAEGRTLCWMVAAVFLLAWVARRPFSVIMASGLAVILALKLGANQRGGTVGFGLGMSPWSYALKQCEALIHYLRLAVWPHPLILDYGTDVVHHLSAVWPQAVLLLSLLGGTAYALVRKPALGFAGAWIFIILAPSSSFLPLTTQTEAEHRMYLPLAALVTLAVLGLYVWAGRRSYAAWGVLALALGAATYSRNADYRTELNMWEVTVRDRPGNARAHYDLGCALLEVEDYRRAEAAFQEALEVDSDYGDAHCNLGLCYTRLGDPQRALHQYWTATWIDPDDVQSQYNLGCALDELGELHSAMGRYRTATRLDPEYGDAQAALGSVLLRLKQPSAALAPLEVAVRLQPDNATTLTNYGDALVAQGRDDDAIANFDKILQQDPDNLEVHKKLSVLLADDGQGSRALTEDAAVLRLEPESAEAHYTHANHLLKTSQPQLAVEEFNAALKLRPDYPEAANNLGSVLKLLGRATEAQAAFNRALELKPDFAEARYNLGTLLLAQGQLADAEGQFRSVIQIDPGYAEAHGNLGSVMVKEGRYTEATLEYQEALRLKPDYVDARHNLDALQKALAPPGN